MSMGSTHGIDGKPLNRFDGLDVYQEFTAKTSVYPGVGSGSNEAISYSTLGLVGESGEVAECVKKMLRGDPSRAFEPTRELIKKELGDVMFYLARVATEFRLSLSDIAAENERKLLDRKARGVIKGSGDAR